MICGFLADLEIMSVTMLQSLWRQYLILMKVSGLTFANDPPHNLLKLFSFLMTCLSWISLMLFFYYVFFPLYDAEGFALNEKNINVMTTVFYMIRCALMASALYVAFHREDCMQRVFQYWSTLRLPHEISQHLETSVSSSTKNAVVVALIIFTFSEIVAMLDWEKGGYPVALLLPYLVQVCVNSISGVFCWLMATTLTALFSAVNECFYRPHLNSRLPLEILCSMFYTASDIVSAADSSLNVLFGVHMLTNLLQCCFDTYTFVFESDQDRVRLTLTFFGGFMAFCMFWFVFWGAANINKEAHGLLDYIHLLPVTNMKPSEVTQLLVLQNRLSTYGSGFSIFGVVIITRGSLPVLLSCYATYVFLLAQFRPGKTISPPCNCTTFGNNT